MSEPFLRPRLCGGRFENSGIPLEVLPDLLALQKLVTDVARSEFLRQHPSEQQVPPGFAENLKLKLTGIGQGSAVAEISLDQSRSDLPALPNRFEEYARQAADIIHDVIEVGQRNEDIPDYVPSQFLNHFTKFGQSLLDDERIEFQSPGRPQPATLTQQSRTHLLERLQVRAEGVLTTVLGRVPELDHDRRKFEFWPVGGRKISLSIPESNRETVVRAFDGYWQGARISLTGVGILAGNGKLERFGSIQELKLLGPLDVDAQLDKISMLRDGWLDGEGDAPERAELEWFSARFDELYPSDLPLPHLYPTLDGGLQAEWSIRGFEMDLKVDLKSHAGAWDETGPNDHTYGLDLNLDERSDWERLGERVRATQVDD